MVGNETIAAKKLAKFWKDLADQKLYDEWKRGYLYGMFFEQSLYDSKILNDYIEQTFFDKPIYRHLSIGIANVLNGSFVTFDEHTTNKDMI